MNLVLGMSQKRYWYTDGVSEKWTPNDWIPGKGWKPGRLPNIKQNRWYTNGADDVLVKAGEIAPEGYVRKRSSKGGRKQRMPAVWWTDGRYEVLRDGEKEPLPGWRRGRKSVKRAPKVTRGKDARRYGRWFNNGVENRRFFLDQVPETGWVPGRLPFFNR